MLARAEGPALLFSSVDGQQSEFHGDQAVFLRSAQLAILDDILTGPQLYADRMSQPSQEEQKAPSMMSWTAMCAP